MECVLLVGIGSYAYRRDNGVYVTHLEFVRFSGVTVGSVQHLPKTGGQMYVGHLGGSGEQRRNFGHAKPCNTATNRRNEEHQFGVCLPPCMVGMA